MGGAATRLGDILNEAYELEELVSSTGKLEIYRATDKRTRSAVRIKLLRPEFALQSHVVEQFLRAPRSRSEVSHPCLPWLRVDADDTGIPFVVEEAVDGRTLAGLIGSFPQGLPMSLVSQLTLPLLEALALAHRHGMVHGRIDAAHVRLLGAAHAPSPKWIGLGGIEDAADPAQDSNYQAPECAAPHSKVSPSADVFAVGVLLYTMMSGELPYRSGKKSAVPLDEIAPHVPASWVDLTAECLRERPKRRLKDAGAVLARLRACLGEVAAAPSAGEVAAAPSAGEVAVTPSAGEVAPTPSAAMRTTPVVAAAPSNWAAASPVPAGAASAVALAGAAPASLTAAAAAAMATATRAPRDRAAKQAAAGGKGGRASSASDAPSEAPNREDKALAPTPVSAAAAALAAATLAPRGRAAKQAAARGAAAKVVSPESDVPSDSPSAAPAQDKAFAPALGGSAVAAARAQPAAAAQRTAVSSKRGAAKPSEVNGAGEPQLGGDQPKRDGAAKIVEANHSDRPRAAEAEPRASVDKKLAAQSALEKLTAKHKPTKEATDRASPKPAAAPAQAAAAGLPPENAGVTALASDARTARGPRPNPAQVAAVALTAAQLDALRALRTRDDDDRDRWFGFVLLLLCIVALQLAVPLLCEDSMTRARALFGANLRVVASGFAVLAWVGTVRAWIVQLQEKAFVQRVTTLVALAVALCITVISVALFPHSARFEALAGIMRRALPWGSAALFSLLGFRMLLRAVRQLPGGLTQGAAALLLAAASLVGAGQAARGGMRMLHASATAQREAALERDGDRSPLNPLPRLPKKTSLSGTLEEQQDLETLHQRTQTGASEDDDLKVIDEVGDTQRRNRQALENLKKGLSSENVEPSADPPAGSN